MTLTEFLLARIAEDEAAARGALGGRWTWASVDFNSWDVAEHGHRHDPARSLRECEAKRAVISAALSAAEAVDDEGCGHTASDIGSETEPCRHAPPPPGNLIWGSRHPEPYDSHPIYSGCHGVPVARTILAPLASVYADHPDFRDEWRVEP